MFLRIYFYVKILKLKLSEKYEKSEVLWKISRKKIY